MRSNDEIKELFSEKLGNFEAPVRPDLWSGISSQLNTAAASSAAGGMTLLSKVVIGFSVAASIGLATFLVIDGNDKKENEDKNSPVVSVPGSSSEQPNEELFDDGVRSEGTTSENILTDAGSVSEDDSDHSNVIVDESQDVVQNGYQDTDPIMDNGTQAGDEGVVMGNDPEKQPKKQDADQNNNIVDPTPVPDPIITSSGIEFELPNVFSPNGDGVHDELFITGIEELKEFNLVVLDQKNKVVFQTAETGFRWNGTDLNNEALPEGDYIYYITARDSKGAPVTKYNRLRIITTKR